jgi:hypothetical protein
MEDAFVTAAVFAGIYFVIKVFTDFLLKRKMIITGNVDKAGILESPKDNELNSYPTLKWGLVAFFAGAGFLVIALMNKGGSMALTYGNNTYLPVGIELVAISLGFLVYFVIARLSSK